MPSSRKRVSADAAKPTARIMAPRRQLAPPGLHPATILLAVLGESPAVLTETVWALARQEQPFVIPARILVLTTTVGARRLHEELFAESRQFGGRSPWQALRDELLQGLPPAQADRLLVLEPERIITSRAGPDGVAQPLDDLRTRADNDAAADFILEQVRAITANPDTRLIASIAGGRKTMGALLYAAMTLIGRETDRLTHVLVNPPFDQRLDPPFFFPPPQSVQHKLVGRDRTTSTNSSASARIELADVPFVPLRNGFEELDATVGGFAGLVTRYSRALLQRADHVPTIAFDEARPTIVIDGHRIELTPKEAAPRLQLAILATLLAVQPLLPPDGKIDSKSFAQIVRAHHRHPWKLDAADQKTARSIAEKIDHSAPPERIQDLLARLDGARVTRTLSQFRTAVRKQLELHWLERKGCLRLPRFRLAAA